MERRKSNRNSYVKLVTSNAKDSSRNSIPHGSNLHRSRSMRDSIRKLKVKLNHPGLVHSPFKFNVAVHNRERHYEKFTTTKEESDDELDPIDLPSTPFASDKYLKTNKSTYDMDLIIPCDTIEDLMSTLPVPRKACKLLQIPETYCAKYLQEQKKLQEQRKLRDQSQYDCSEENSIVFHKSMIDYNHKNPIYNDLSKSISQGIYGTTRHRTATIRKPMPYLNSNEIKHINLNKWWTILVIVKTWPVCHFTSAVIILFLLTWSLDD
ncbi:uncharacterized protein LOC142219870 [Haematobia irritans]|uniref:uncharacterized protein LOC142219870 n=1 Tax=Haematobia irritans TaxID=7368 RepID=UPI003F500EC0